MFAGLSSATNWKLNSAYWSHGLISLKCGNEGVALTKNFAKIKTRPNCIVAKVYFLHVYLRNSGLGKMQVTNKGTNIVLSFTSVNETRRDRS